MANAGQHRLFHQGIEDFLTEIGVEPTRKNMGIAKRAFKQYLDVHSVASLTDKEYSTAIFEVFGTMACEFGVEIPRHDAEQSMQDLLKKINHD